MLRPDFCAVLNCGHSGSKRGWQVFRVYTDFNNMEDLTIKGKETEVVRIGTHYFNKSLINYGRPGMLVVLATPSDVEVDGLLGYDEDYSQWFGAWFGIPDWSTVRYPIQVDFTTMDQLGRVPIPEDDINFYFLEAGARYLLENDFFEVDIQIVKDDISQSWYGVPDWSTRRFYANSLQKEMLRVHVDFTRMPSENKVPIKIIHNKWLTNYIRSGLRVLLYGNGFEVEGNVEWNEDDGRWYGIVDWSTKHDVPILPPDLPANG
jgi:hypothetical protein